MSSVPSTPPHPFCSAISCNHWNSYAVVLLVASYLSFPLSITSFNAFMIFFFGVSQPCQWTWNTSIYIPHRFTLRSAVSRRCFLLSPTWFTISSSSDAIAAMRGSAPASRTSGTHNGMGILGSLRISPQADPALTSNVSPARYPRHSSVLWHLPQLGVAPVNQVIQQAQGRSRFSCP